MSINASHRPHLVAVNTFGPQGPSPDEQRQMSEFGIGFDGRYYRYREYRYDHLSDALNYARLEKVREPNYVKPEYVPRHADFESPGDAEQALMAEYGVTFDGRDFRYGSYRYERFIDAINYARLERARRP